MWYAAYTVVGVVGLAGFVIHGDVHGRLSAWCMALSNAWGLLLLTLLMGFGLVAVPRHLWRQASPLDQLRGLYCLVAARHEARLNACRKLQDSISFMSSELAARHVPFQDERLEQAFASLHSTFQKCEALHARLAVEVQSTDSLTLEVAVEEMHSEGTGRSAYIGHLARLHHTLKQDGLEARRAACCFDMLVEWCLLCEDLEEQQVRSVPQFTTAVWGHTSSRCCGLRFWQRTRLWLLMTWLQVLRPKAFRALACMSATLSAAIILGQSTMFSSRWSLSVLSVFFRGDHGVGLTQVLCGIPFAYMICTSFWSVFRLKISGWYGLYPDHNTDTASLLWCALILARLAPPLCYHFLLLTGVDGTEFQRFMGQMDVVPILGGSFNEVFPCLVGVLSLCNLLDVYTRVVQCLGLQGLTFEGVPVDSEDIVVHGKWLVRRERWRRSEDAGCTERREIRAVRDSRDCEGGLELRLVRD